MGRRRGSRAGQSKLLTVGVRLEPEQLRRVDGFLQDSEAKIPGLKLTRSEAIRMLIGRALDAHEGVYRGHRDRRRMLGLDGPAAASPEPAAPPADDETDPDSGG